MGAQSGAGHGAGRPSRWFAPGGLPIAGAYQARRPFSLRRPEVRLRQPGHEAGAATNAADVAGDGRLRA